MNKIDNTKFNKFERELELELQRPNKINYHYLVNILWSPAHSEIFIDLHGAITTKLIEI